MSGSQKEKLKHMVEALLFASSDGMTTQEVVEKLGVSEKRCNSVLKGLQKERADQPIQVSFEGNRWRMLVRKDLSPKLHSMLSLPAEVSRSLIKTLAVVAYKAPVKQSEIVKIRGNKAYDHIKKLEEEHFISTKPHGRTKLIKLNQRFYDYFQLTRGKEKYLFEQTGD